MRLRLIRTLAAPEGVRRVDAAGPAGRQVTCRECRCRRHQRRREEREVVACGDAERKLSSTRVAAAAKPRPTAMVVRHVTICGYGHGLQRAIIDESQHRKPERLIMAQHRRKDGRRRGCDPIPEASSATTTNTHAKPSLIEESLDRGDEIAGLTEGDFPQSTPLVDDNGRRGAVERVPIERRWRVLAGLQVRCHAVDQLALVRFGKRVEAGDLGRMAARTCSRVGLPVTGSSSSMASGNGMR